MVRICHWAACKNIKNTASCKKTTPKKKNTNMELIASVQPSLAHPLLLSSMVMRRWMAACLQAGEADAPCSCGRLRMRQAFPAGPQAPTRGSGSYSLEVWRWIWCSRKFYDTGMVYGEEERQRVIVILLYSLINNWRWMFNIQCEVCPHLSVSNVIIGSEWKHQPLLLNKAKWPCLPHAWSN